MKSHSQTPLFQKSEEIFETLKNITALFPKENEILMELKNQLMENAITIQAKLTGAYAVKLYDLKMENATLIRKAAREILVLHHGLEMHGFKEVEYYQIVRNQIEEFRLLFIAWVTEFNQQHFITDSWGLFNPPGISPDHEQSEDELDFLDEDDEE
ncbi:hypothetical protein [uncultured Fluviicola sp.]|uniref:hypothetical protein n=1 Tax=uncultured Fluviicola sp. TaxID=463303 RepID=UPI0025FF71F6|nr:hypothetical protein [uncultured Fluviicola sp.]